MALILACRRHRLLFGGNCWVESSPAKVFLDLYLHAEDRRLERVRNAHVARVSHPDYPHEEYLSFLEATD